MNPYTLHKFSMALAQLEIAIWVGSMFIWLIAFYMLNLLFRQKFLLWLIWGEVTGLISFAYDNRVYFIGYQNYPSTTGVQAAVIGQLLRFASLLISTVGIVMVVHLLQAKLAAKRLAERETDDPIR